MGIDIAVMHTLASGNRRVPTWCGIASLLIALVLFSPLVAQQPSLQIASPTSGTLVAPGQQFTVTVTIAQGTVFNGVFVVAQNLGFSSVLSSSPFVFTFTAPGAGFVGPLSLTAVGVDASGNAMFSRSVTISVEPTAPISSLGLSPPQVGFSFAGQQVPLIVSGTFLDASIADLTHSPGIVYASNDSKVAQVGTDGMLTAVGPGSTQVVVTYGGKSQSISVKVPNAARGDLNGDGQINVDDLNIILAALDSDATQPADARDLNKDGVINELDALILATLCTRPGCATRANLVTPTITWSTPAAITYGTALSDTQLNAAASIPGSFVYSPAAGTVLRAGNHTLFVTFNPSDSSRYSPGISSVILQVNPGMACAADIGGSVSVTRSGYTYNFATQRFYQTVNLSNSSASTITGPISLVLDSLSSNATLFNASGMTNCAAPLSSPYITTGATSLAPGASVSVVLQFTNSTKAAIAYSTRVLAGPGSF